MIVGVVTSEGKEVVGFGTTNIQGGSLPGGDTCFGIGSVTKVFTGLILADAVQQGLLELDGSANIHLASELQLPSDEITLRQLVTHTSGLPDYPANIRVFRDLDHDGINDSTQYNPGKNYSRQNLSD
ncbi:class A beta-lactamase-related serine hydrolase [bacterium]|nr:class A beta-lactamase-related serine hydrolase [bacterium]